MRAVRYHEPGDPSVLTLDDIDRPTPAPDEVLVAIRAASINPTDVKRRQRGAGPFPKTTGSDFAGEVVEVGERVTTFAPGDRVCGTGLHTERFSQGSFAEFVAVPTDVVTPLPDAVGYQEGAAVAIAGITAWLALLTHGRLRPTETCLVHGGTGGVGHLAVQLADRLGARTVATAHPDRRDAAVGFGADEVIDYTADDLQHALLEVSPAGYDVVLDHRAHDYLGLDLEVAAFEGTVVVYGGARGAVEFSPAAIGNDLRVQSFTMSNLATRPERPSVGSVLDRVLALVERGVLEPTIARTYDLEQAEAFHRAVLEDHYVGKLVVLP